MAFHSSDQEEGIFDINITPFVDVVLVLLVIFMVTTPMMVQQALKVNLPDSKVSDSLDPKTLAIAITANGQYIVNGNLATLELLRSEAKNAFEESPQVQVVFAADLDSRHEAVVKAMDVVRQIGITRFAFQVVKQEQVQNSE